MDPNAQDCLEVLSFCLKYNRQSTVINDAGKKAGRQQAGDPLPFRQS